MLHLTCLIALLFSSAMQDQHPVHSLVWQFSRGQEFYVEENHRQLYTVTIDGTRASSYLDYSLLQHYQVKSVRFQEVILEVTLDKVRINNPNEAGKEAIEVLKKKEGTSYTCYLRRKDQLWQLDVINHPNLRDKTFSTLLLTLGNASFDETQSAWTQSWAMPIAPPQSPTNKGGEGGVSLGQTRLVMKMQTKLSENPQRFRTEVRPEFQWEPPSLNPPLTKRGEGGVVQVQDVPSATAGLAFFDTRSGRWDYLDFRVNSIFKIKQGERMVEMKQDFTAIYRLSTSRPVWREK